MKNLKNFMAAITLLTVLVLGTMTANAGILVGDFAGSGQQDPCSEAPTKNDSGTIMSDITGIIVAGFTGIIVAGRDGIIVAGKGTTGNTDCGIIVAGRDGLLMSD
jgi:hypothetical protein